MTSQVESAIPQVVQRLPIHKRRWTMNNQEVITILEGLIRTCRRGQEVFRNAAETIQNSEFRRLFNIFAQQRGQFISELKSEIHRLGGDGRLEGNGTMGLPQNTLPFRTAASKAAAVRDEAGIIAECRREEETAVND